MKADESCFDDTYDNRVMMKTQLSSRMARDKNNWFLNQLAEEDIFVEYVKVIQEFFSKISSLSELESNSLLRLEEDILSPLSENANEIEEFRLLIHNPECNGNELLNLLFGKYTFIFFTQGMLESFADMITEKIQCMNNMNDITADEARLFQFCNENRLSVPAEKYVQDTYGQSGPGNDFLMEQLLGNDEYNRLKKRNVFRKRVIEFIKEYCSNNEIIKRDNKSQLYIREKNDSELEQYFKKIKGNNYLKSDVFAVIEERGLSEWFNYTDLLKLPIRISDGNPYKYCKI